MRVLDVNLPFEPVTIAAFSDIHLDAADHAADRLKEDMEYAASIDAKFLVGGDLASLILPKDAKRYTRGKDKIDRDAAVNHIARQAYEMLLPYVDRIIGIGMGNHETSILKYHGVDVTLMILTLLNQHRPPDDPIIHLGFTGYIRFIFQNGKHRCVENWWYHHGKGGGAPVTKGMIDLNRIVSTWIADVYWLGHKHTKISDQGMRIAYLDRVGNVYTKNRVAFYTAGYKGELSVEEYDENGYELNYSEENFYSLEAQGFQIVDYIPRYFANKQSDTLERNLRHRDLTTMEAQ